MNELGAYIGAYIGAKIDEAVDAYDGSTESVKENIETIDDALAVSEERQKWKQAINNIKAEIEAKNTSIEDFADTHGWVNGLTNEHNAHEADLAIITKHTKELMK